MIERVPEIALKAINRAKEIEEFLSDNVRIKPSEELMCGIFFEPEDGDHLNGRNTTKASLQICAWVSTNDSKLYARPLGNVSYPDDWCVKQREGHNSYITDFDTYQMDEETTEEVRRYRPSQIIFTADMYDNTSD